MFKNGKTVKGSFLFIKGVLNNRESSRFTIIIAPKAYPKAVNRNRVRRILGGLISSRLDRIIKGYDLAVVVRAKAEEEALRDELNKLLLRLFA